MTPPRDWEVRGRPPTLFRRFEFDSYARTRAFLDAVADLSEEIGVHPQNINFGSTYVNITLEAAEGTEPGAAEYAFAARIDALSGSSVR